MTPELQPVVPYAAAGLFDVPRRATVERLFVQARWRAALEDPFRFIAECVHIESPRARSGRELMELYDYQREGLDTLLGSQYTVVLKSRQLGWTTLMAALALWQLMRPGSRVLFVSYNQDQANKALDTVKFMWRYLPEWAKQCAPKLTAEPKTSMEFTFEDGMQSEILSLPATKRVGAGNTVDLVIADEFALSEFQSDALRSLLPTVEVRGGRFVLFSTARGAHNAFAKTFQAAEKGENEFTPLFYPWTVSKTFDRKKYEERKRYFASIGEPWLLHSEYPETTDEAFRETGKPRFPGLPPLEEFDPFPFSGRLVHQGARGIEFVADPAGTEVQDAGNLRLVSPELPDDVDEWVLAVDTSKGVLGDWTAAQLLAYDPESGLPRLYGYWHANDVEEHDAAKPLDLLGRWVNDARGRSALIVVESVGGNGSTLINELHRHHRYPRMYRHRYTGHRKHKRADTFGFPTNQANRPQVISHLASLLDFDGGETLQGIYPALRAELGTFVRRDVSNRVREEADVGCHDDLVMSTAIGCWVLSERASRAEERSAGTDAVRGAGPPPGNNLHKYLVEIPERKRQMQERAAAEEMSELLQNWAESQHEFEDEWTVAW